MLWILKKQRPLASPFRLTVRKRCVLVWFFYSFDLFLRELRGPRIVGVVFFVMTSFWERPKQLLCLQNYEKLILVILLICS